MDITIFESVYRKLGRDLGVKGIEGDKANVKALVREILEREEIGNWFLIIDNADDL